MDQEYQEYINLPYFKVHKAPTYEEWLKIKNKQLPLILLDLRSEYLKQQIKEKLNLEKLSEQLYKNQHLWNWVLPFTNIKVNKDNANSMFDFNKETAVSTFTTATGLTNPVITAKSTLGSLIGAGLGNYIAGNTGSLIGSLVGGLVGIPKVQKSKLASKNNDIGKPLYGIENQEQAIANALIGYKKFSELITSNYWKNHLRKQGMTKKEINDYIVNLLLSAIEAPLRLMSRSNYKDNSFGRHVVFEKDGKIIKREILLPLDVGVETVIHEVAHAANKGGRNYKVGEAVDRSFNKITLHNAKHLAKINDNAKQKLGSLLNDLQDVEEQRSRAIVTHQKLFEYGTTWDDVQKLILGKILGMTPDQMDKAAKFINDNLYSPDKYSTPSNIKLIFNWFDTESMTDFMHNVRQYAAPIGVGGIYGLTEYGKNNKN